MATVLSEVYKVNIVNCKASLIISYPNGPLFPGMIAVTPNGNLWGSDGVSIFQIDTLDGTRFNVNYMDLPNPGGGLGMVDLNDSTLIIGQVTNSLQVIEYKLFLVNVKTGVTSFIANFGGLNGDLTWYDQDLYVSHGYTFLKLRLAHDNLSIAGSTLVPTDTTQWNMLNYGLGTATFPKDINYIIGSKGWNLLKICPIKGLNMPLCPNINFQSDIYDIASKRLPVQVPEPTQCKGNFTDVGELTGGAEHSYSLIPNPGNDFTLINFSKTHKNINVALSDNKGTILINKSAVNAKSIRLEFPGLDNGVYLLQITTESNSFYQKLVISH